MSWRSRVPDAVERDGVGLDALVEPHLLPSPAIRSSSFITDGDGAAAPAAQHEATRAPRVSRRLRENLSKTREALGAEIQATLFETLDDETWERLEEALIMADVGGLDDGEGGRQARDGGLQRRGRGRRGADPAARCSRTRPGDRRRRAGEGVGPARRRGAIDLRHGPTVIMVVGVNGTGKTTTIGKLAWHLRTSWLTACSAPPTPSAPPPSSSCRGGRSARACDIVTGPEGSDPGSVAFEAVRRRPREAPTS